MPNQAPILRPDLVRTPGNMFIQKPVVGDAANTFGPQSLVKLAAGALVLCATAEVLLYGITPDGSKTAAQTAPEAIFGEQHWVFDCRAGEIEINVAAAAGGDIAIGAGAQTPATAVIGTAYGIVTPTTGLYAGIQMLDLSNTATVMFIVVGKVDNVLDTDYNGRVRVKPVPAVIQA